MSAKIMETKENYYKTFSEMKVGQAGLIIDTHITKYYMNIVYKVSEDCVANLTNYDSWSNIEFNKLQVEILPEGTKIEITTEV